jgi:hypothetical protein
MPWLAAALLPALVSQSVRASTTPAALVLTPSDLPVGYMRDDSLENADATARTTAYATLMLSDAFVAYRNSSAAVVQYVARLRSRADAVAYLNGESAAVDRDTSAIRITLPVHLGDHGSITYQAHGSHGTPWVLAIFSEGPYVTTLGSYSETGEQEAIDQLVKLAAVVDGRMRQAARTAPEPAPTRTPAAAHPAVRITSLRTTTLSGRAVDRFKPHSTVYWRLAWTIAGVANSAPETVRETLAQGSKVLLANALNDRGYAGANTLTDHMQLDNAPAGSYTLSVTIGLAGRTATATHTFHVAP